MSRLFSDYSLFEKALMTLDDIRGEGVFCDRFISGFNQSDRVCKVFQSISCQQKHWLIFPEYDFARDTWPKDKPCFESTTPREDEFIKEYFEAFPLANGERICVDITGFMRPQLLFLMRFLFEHDVKRFQLLYSEPLTYTKGESTAFSDEVVTEVRQVCGFEGEHTPALAGDFLIVGCGYDHKLIEHVANHKMKAKKIQLFGFPALRPHMYQENRVRTQRGADAFGNVEEIFFAPAYDPFVTAEVLGMIVEKYRSEIANLYLSPLATKPQVAGFALFYLRERLTVPASIVFPFSTGYSQRTSVGISHIWRYTVDFNI
jgi:hypothetical protein